MTTLKKLKCRWKNYVFDCYKIFFSNFESSRAIICFRSYVARTNKISLWYSIWKSYFITVEWIIIIKYPLYFLAPTSTVNATADEQSFENPVTAENSVSGKQWFYIAFFSSQRHHPNFPRLVFFMAKPVKQLVRLLWAFSSLTFWINFSKRKIFTLLR